jgi:monoamine oxidase
MPELSRDRNFICNKSKMGSYAKIILLYKRAYWIEKGYSG